jgi:hypothetical protein
MEMMGALYMEMNTLHLTWLSRTMHEPIAICKEKILKWPNGRSVIPALGNAYGQEIECWMHGQSPDQAWPWWTSPDANAAAAA